MKRKKEHGDGILTCPGCDSLLEYDEIEWSGDHVDEGENIKESGICPHCGREFQNVYTYHGIYDPELDSYLYEY